MAGRGLTDTERAALEAALADDQRGRALLDLCVERIPMEGHDGRSGARLEWARLPGGEQLIVKRLDPDLDLTMRITGDRTGREHDLRRAGVLDQLPAGVGHALLASWPEPSGATLVLRDVGEHLPLGRISRAECQRVFAAAAAVHEAFDGVAVPAACPLETRLAVFAPRSMQSESPGDHGLPQLVLRGWELFSEVVPTPVVEAVFAAHEKPGPLAARLSENGSTLLHGDLWLVNVALEPDQVTLLDWALTCTGPAALDYVWFLTGNAARVAASRDELLDDVRAACGPRHDEQTLHLALFAGLVELGWNKALDAVEHVDPVIRQRELEDLAWWVSRARATLDAGLLP